MHTRVLCILLLCLVPFVVQACSTSQSHDGEPSVTVEERRPLPGTPLALEVVSPGGRGYGSGILVHPRIILTAGHIVASDATSVIAFTDPAGPREAVRIIKVLPSEPAVDDRPQSRPIRDWSIPGDDDEDWALLILASPLSTLPATPAPLLGNELPTMDSSLRVAGFPFADHGRDRARRSERRVMDMNTPVIPTPSHARSSTQRFFGRGPSSKLDHSGASGGPVFLEARADPAPLVGIYIGEVSYDFLGLRLRSELVFRRLPIAEIHRAIDALNSVQAP